MRIFRPVVVSTIFLLNACVAPMPFSGYIPDGQGVLTNASGIVGVKNVLHIEVGEASIVTQGDISSNSMLELNINVIVPKAATAQLVSSEFVVNSAQLAKPVTLVVKKITASGPESFMPLSELVGETYDPGWIGNRTNKVFHLWFDPSADVPKVDSFMLYFPKLRVNGKIYQVEPVSFRFYSRWGVYVGPPGP